MTLKKDEAINLRSIAMVDPATGWLELHSIPEAKADLVAIQVELAWLTRYLFPNKIIVDRGKVLLI